jgi:hypothetical protein
LLLLVPVFGILKIVGQRALAPKAAVAMVGAQLIIYIVYRILPARSQLYDVVIITAVHIPVGRKHREVQRVGIDKPGRIAHVAVDFIHGVHGYMASLAGRKSGAFYRYGKEADTAAVCFVTAALCKAGADNNSYNRQDTGHIKGFIERRMFLYMPWCVTGSKV